MSVQSLDFVIQIRSMLDPREMYEGPLAETKGQCETLAKDCCLYAIAEVDDYRFRLDSGRLYIENAFTDKRVFFDFDKALDDLAASRNLKIESRDEPVLENRNRQARTTYRTVDGSGIVETHEFGLRVWDALGRAELSGYLEDAGSANFELELLVRYIGQSKNIRSRLSSHKWYQRALATKPENKEIMTLLMSIDPTLITYVSPGSSSIPPIEQISSSNIDDSQKIDLGEIALITFFRPEWNTQHVNDDFHCSDSVKIRNTLRRYDGVNVELQCAYRLTMRSKGREVLRKFTTEDPFIRCRFASDAVERAKEGVNLLSLMETYD